MINVKGYRLLVKPRIVERTTKSGFILVIEGSDEDKLEEAGQQSRQGERSDHAHCEARQ